MGLLSALGKRGMRALRSGDMFGGAGLAIPMQQTASSTVNRAALFNELKSSFSWKNGSEARRFWDTHFEGLPDDEIVAKMREMQQRFGLG